MILHEGIDRREVKYVLHRRFPDAASEEPGARAANCGDVRNRLYPAAAISRVALIGSFSTLHNALRFAARGRSDPSPRNRCSTVLTPTCSATSATDRRRLIRASRRWQLKLGLRGNVVLLPCCGPRHNRQTTILQACGGMRWIGCGDNHTETFGEQASLRDHLDGSGHAEEFVKCMRAFEWICP